MVPRIVQKCQGYCQRSLIPADHKDYFLVKSFARSYYVHNGKKLSKVAPQCVHFNEDCLKEYARRKLDTYYENFPFTLIKINQETYDKISDETKAYILSFGVPAPCI